MAASPALKRGSAVLVRFPFSDLSNARLRPAIVLADVGRGDFVLCQVTSNFYGDPAAIELADASFKVGGLRRTSYARPGKSFTASERLIDREVGRLTDDRLYDVTEAVISIIRGTA